MTLDIIVPMAGRGSRFAVAGYTDPKPLISFGGRRMIEWVIDNLRPARPHRFIFLCLAEHLERYPTLRETLAERAPGCAILPVATVTEGAACTVRLAAELIGRERPLMIANSDQYVDVDINRYLAALDDPANDGLIMTFRSTHPKWSYCRMAGDGRVTEVAEKQVISTEATVGIYNFRRGQDFLDASDAMIRADKRVNGEFYVAPVYNELIARGRRIAVSNIGSEETCMYGLGTPEDLTRFLATPVFAQQCRGSG